MRHLLLISSHFRVALLFFLLSSWCCVRLTTRSIVSTRIDQNHCKILMLCRWRFENNFSEFEQVQNARSISKQSQLVAIYWLASIASAVVSIILHLIAGENLDDHGSELKMIGISLLTKTPQDIHCLQEGCYCSPCHKKLYLMAPGISPACERY